MVDEFGGDQSDSGDDSTTARKARMIVGDGGIQTDTGREKLDNVLRALLDRRRRYALYFLAENEVSDVEELATHVAAMEENTAPDTISSGRIEQVQISLVHADLPLLEENGFVEFDRRSDTIRYSYPPDLLEEMLDLCSEFDTAEVS